MRLPYNDDEVIEEYPGIARVMTEEELMSEATKKKISKAMMGKNNPAYKDGRRSYDRIAGAKKGEGVHHKDGNSKNNKPSNLEVYKLTGKERAKHEKQHDRSKNFSSSGGRKDKPRGYTAKRLVKTK